MLDAVVNGLHMALDRNHFSQGACYHDKAWRDMAVFNLLRDSHKLFGSVSVIRNIDRLIAFRQRGFSIADADVHELFHDLDPAYLDAFKIATSFENLFKAQLLSFGYVVHLIDRQAGGKKFALLAEAQYVGPVKLSAIKAAEGSPWTREPYEFKSLKRQTLGLGLLLDDRYGYHRSLRLGSKLLSALQYVRGERNTIHFIVNDVRSLNAKFVDTHLYLRSTFNARLQTLYQATVARHSHLASRPEYALPLI